MTESETLIRGMDVFDSFIAHGRAYCRKCHKIEDSELLITFESDKIKSAFVFCKNCKTHRIIVK